MGALAGTARGCKSPTLLATLLNSYVSIRSQIAVNLLLKPTAGALGSITLPIEGSIRSIRGMRNQDVGQERRLGRHKQGLMEAEGCSQEERDFVISMFATLKSSMKGKQRAK